MVATTTCQNQAAGTCATSYSGYWPDDTSATETPSPTNDTVQYSRDPRSASPTDTTYLTSYTYDALGDLTQKTTPPVPGYPSGRTTSYAYTDGSTTTGGYHGAVPPKGLPYQVTTPGGAVTTALYYANGDVAQVTNPDGQRPCTPTTGSAARSSQTVYSDTYPGGLTTTLLLRRRRAGDPADRPGGHRPGHRREAHRAGHQRLRRRR